MHSPSSDGDNVLRNALDISVWMMGGSQACWQIVSNPIGMPDGSQHVEIATRVAGRRYVTHRCTQSVRQTLQPHRLVARPEVGDFAVG